MKSTIYPFLGKQMNEIPKHETYIIKSMIKKSSIEYDFERLFKQLQNPNPINPFTALKGISESELKDLLWIITNNIILMESDTQ